MDVKHFIFFFIYLFVISCSSEYDLNDFKFRKDANKNIFQENKMSCHKHSSLLAARQEGSKRAGEIFIDQKKYFLSCMKRKGWVLIASD